MRAAVAVVVVAAALCAAAFARGEGLLMTTPRVRGGNNRCASHGNVTACASAEGCAPCVGSQGNFAGCYNVRHEICCNFSASNGWHSPTGVVAPLGSVCCSAGVCPAGTTQCCGTGSLACCDAANPVCHTNQWQNQCDPEVAGSRRRV